MEQITLGYSALIERFERLQGGEMIFLAARPGMGKSWLAKKIAEILVENHRKKVRFFSLDGSDDGMNVDDISREVTDGHFDFIVVDFLQMLSGSVAANRRPDIDVMMQLHTLAKNQNVSILVLSTLSRRVDKRADHIPQLKDIPASWSVLPYIDVVLFLLRDGYYAPSQSELENDILIIPYELQNTDTEEMK